MPVTKKTNEPTQDLDGVLSKISDQLEAIQNTLYTLSLIQASKLHPSDRLCAQLEMLRSYAQGQAQKPG